ncbi:MAG: hypothetical protein WC209_18385 [Ignavibacteriaceae bacterium]|jgi:hypothetical protein
MKTIVSIILLLVCSLFFSCKEESNPTVPQIGGKYSGTFKITQGNYIQQGDVVFVFSDSTYEQDGQIESPTNAKISDKGTFRLDNGNHIFNAGRELQMVVYPAWSLVGSFKYLFENNIVTLVQETNSMRYEIILYKNN